MVRFHTEATKRVIAKAMTRHGLYRSPEYYVWDAMIQRCTNPNAKTYRYYGERGITVCERWRKFENFYADMGPRPTPKHEIDRFPNNDGGYEPGNVRWATRKEQSNNRRDNRLLTLNGETKTMQQWCDTLELNYKTVSERIRRYGWTTEQALTLKPQKGKRPA